MFEEEAQQVSGLGMGSRGLHRGLRSREGRSFPEVVSRNVNTAFLLLLLLLLRSVGFSSLSVQLAENEHIDKKNIWTPGPGGKL